MLELASSEDQIALFVALHISLHNFERLESEDSRVVSFAFVVSIVAETFVVA